MHPLFVSSTSKFSGIELGRSDTQPLKEVLYIVLTEGGISIFDKEEQSSKAWDSTIWTEEGISKLVKDIHFINVWEHISLITDCFSNITSFKDEQDSKADDAITSTDDGIVIFNNEEHFLKAQMPMYFKEEGNEISFSEEHLLNAAFFILVTEEGIITWVNDIQFSKEWLPILWTVEGIFISLKEVQP